MSYHQLSTTKYWKESAKAEIRAYRKQKNREAVQSFFTFLFVVAVVIGVAFALKTMPTWLPVVENFVADQEWITNLFGKSA